MQDAAEWFAPGQKFGPQHPGQPTPVPLPYTNEGGNLGKNAPERIKQQSGHLMYPLQQVCIRWRVRSDSKALSWPPEACSDGSRPLQVTICVARCLTGVDARLQEMADLDTIDISHDSVVVLKHHGSYMQQDRDFQVRNQFNGMQADKAKYAQSFQVHSNSQLLGHPTAKNSVFPEWQGATIKPRIYRLYSKKGA